MFIKKILFACMAPVLVTACSMEEITAVNKKISDAAHSLSTGGLSSGNNNDGGMPWMTKTGNSGPRQDARHDYRLPVDVDTAAARLKRRYQFISSQEMESLRNRNNHGDWSAAAIDEAHSVWEAMPGSYYKMGHDWNDYDRLVVELEKNGTGSRLYITYSSPSKKRLESNELKDLMLQIKQVAEGEINS